MAYPQNGKRQSQESSLVPTFLYSSLFLSCPFFLGPVSTAGRPGAFRGPGQPLRRSPRHRVLFPSSGSRRRPAGVALRHSGRAAAFAPRFGRLPSRPPVRNIQGGNSLRLSDHSPLGSASGERVGLRAAYSLSAALARIRRAGRHTVADPHRQGAAFPPGVPGESEAPPPGPPPRWGESSCGSAPLRGRRPRWGRLHDAAAHAPILRPLGLGPPRAEQPKGKQPSAV